MSILNVLTQRCITSVLHFTTNRGLTGTLYKGELLSRDRLPQDKYLEYVLYPNAETRPEQNASFDKEENWLDFINLSISEINSRFFEVSRSWHLESDVWWCILDFDSEVLTHEGVAFATTNNSYECCIRKSGEIGLEELFAPRIDRKSGWSVERENRAPNLPTCEQAEVLYPQRLSKKFLRSIFVKESDHADSVRGWLSETDTQGVKVHTCPRKFDGCPN